MPVQKLSTTNAFVVTDISGAPAGGLVRVAKKILQSSAAEMARTASYCFASFGIERSGASAGINAVGEDVTSSVAKFVHELAPVAAANELHLSPAKGVPAAALAELIDSDQRHPDAGAPAATVASVMAATQWALGANPGVSDLRVALEGPASHPVVRGLSTALDALGAEVVILADLESQPGATIWNQEVDLILCGSKLGVLSHHQATAITAKAVIPWGPSPVTTRAFSKLREIDCQLIPDFISSGGAQMAGYLDNGITGVGPATNAKLESLAGHPDGIFLAACYDAEAFLASWVDDLPFGRPLAA